MSVDFIFRIAGMVAASVLGWQLGMVVGGEGNPNQLRYVLILSLAGAALGLILTPYVTTYPFRWLRSRIKTVSAPDLVASAVGLIVGLIISALLAFPLSMLPWYFGKVLPFVATVIFSYFGISIMLMKKMDIFDFFNVRRHAIGGGDTSKHDGKKGVLVDTSAIIDGRIADISQTGFLDGTLLIPRFVLEELQHIADSGDVLRRNRGRRGLDMLNRLQKESVVPIQITEIDSKDVSEVDGKLIKLAKAHHYPIITNDYNLNRVAELQGVRVLNINELANAVKPVVLPGEEMAVRIIQEGKEVGQGVGYLDDGTMIVVENGRRHINSDVDVVVTRVLQTVAGRMIFAHLKES
ncbi:MAG: PIN domain-containing protein [Chloroflexi bacterium]|nr:PIN domain-containing protein [Chloroflexota bacterium]